MRRFALILVLAALVPAPAALAQGSNPFGPLPPSAPQPTPAPEPTSPTDQGEVSREALLGIAGGVLGVFVLIGMWITRDARRNLSEDDRRAVDRGRERSPGGSGKSPDTPRGRARVKAQARKKTRAQRRARRANRPR